MYTILRSRLYRGVFTEARWTLFRRTRAALHFEKPSSPAGTRQYRAINPQRIIISWNVLRQWIRNPIFPYHIAGMGLFGTMFYLYYLERAPVAGRLRFNMISPHWERQLGNAWYQRIVEKNSDKILARSTAEHQQVQRVFDRLITHTGFINESWEVNVIDDSEISAYVLPGGKVFVHRGMLDLCTRDDEVAVILGHEIAHNIVGHISERLSRWLILLPLFVIGSFASGMDEDLVQLAIDVAFRLPHERAHELEADNLGLQIMAESSYDASAALDLWSRWEQLQEIKGPEFMTTHPSHYRRLSHFNGWLAEARAKRLSHQFPDNEFSRVFCLQREFCGVERTSGGDFPSAKANLQEVTKIRAGISRFVLKSSNFKDGFSEDEQASKLCQAV